MQTFKESFNLLIEKKLKLPKGETLVKSFEKLGKSKKVSAAITNSGKKFNLYVDDDFLDSFNKQDKAEKALKDFLKVMDI
jgi:hypothetical protein